MYLEKPDDDFLSKNRRKREALNLNPRSTIKKKRLAADKPVKDKPQPDNSHRQAVKEPISAPAEVGENKHGGLKLIFAIFIIAVVVFMFVAGQSGGVDGAKRQFSTFFDGAKNAVVNFGAGAGGSGAGGSGAGGSGSGSSSGSGSGAGSGSGSYGSGNDSGSEGVPSSSFGKGVSVSEDLENSVKQIELKSDLYIVENQGESYNALVCLYYHPQANFVEDNFYNFSSFLVVKNGAAYEFDGCYAYVFDYFKSYYKDFSRAKEIIDSNLSNNNPYKISVSSVEADFQPDVSKNNCAVLAAGSNGIDRLFDGDLTKTFDGIQIHKTTYSDMQNVISEWNSAYSLTEDATN